MSSSARKPSGPTATLVGIPRDRCLWECLSGLLDFLSDGRFIRVLEAEGKGETADLQSQTPLFAGSVAERSSRTQTQPGVTDGDVANGGVLQGYIAQYTLRPALEPQFQPSQTSASLYPAPFLSDPT